jgi:hypothetical protein
MISSLMFGNLWRQLLYALLHSLILKGPVGCYGEDAYSPFGLPRTFSDETEGIPNHSRDGV